MGELPDLHYMSARWANRITSGTTIVFFSYDALVAANVENASFAAPSVYNEDDVDLAVMYTSGTMGKPKASEICRSRALVENAVHKPVRYLV